MPRIGKRTGASPAGTVVAASDAAAEPLAAPAAAPGPSVIERMVEAERTSLAAVDIDSILGDDGDDVDDLTQAALDALTDAHERHAREVRQLVASTRRQRRSGSDRSHVASAVDALRSAVSREQPAPHVELTIHQPDVHVSTPDIKPADVRVDVHPPAPAAAPVVNVTVPEREVHVHAAEMPAQPAPVVNVTAAAAPAAPAPDVHVHMPAEIVTRPVRSRTVVTARDIEGMVEETQTEAIE